MPGMAAWGTLSSAEGGGGALPFVAGSARAAVCPLAVVLGVPVPPCSALRLVVPACRPCSVSAGPPLGGVRLDAGTPQRPPLSASEGPARSGRRSLEPARVRPRPTCGAVPRAALACSPLRRSAALPPPPTAAAKEPQAAIPGIV
jgi:hypothetical protein